MIKKRVFINATACTIGGGAQVAANIIKNSLKSINFEYIYAVSPEVEKHLAALVNIECVDYKKFAKPSNPILGIKTRAEIQEHIRATKPDLVFTVFGPSYLKVDVKELIGIADPWLTHATKESYANHSAWKVIINKMTVWYKKRWINYNNYWVESEAVKCGLIERCRIEAGKIAVIPNTCSDIFRKYELREKYKFSGELIIAVISANYPHKNIEFVSRVINKIAELRPEWRIKLITTLKKTEVLSHKINKEVAHISKVQIEHKGYQTLLGCKEIYEEASLVFHPSLLEAYSATYAEAICMGKPLFVSNYQFSKSACGDAAVYIDPFDSEATAKKIIKYFESEVHQKDLIDKMSIKSSDFLNDAERMISFENLFEEIIYNE